MATAIEKVRRLIADSSVPYHFTDAEIQIFLDLASNSILIGAAFALEAWAASLTGSLLSEKIGDYAYTKKDAESKAALAKEYKRQEAESPYMTWAEMDLSGVKDTTVSEDIE